MNTLSAVFQVDSRVSRIGSPSTSYQLCRFLLFEGPMELNLGIAADRKSLARSMKLDFDNKCDEYLKDERRTHIGASDIGDKCSRKVWFKFRHVLEEKPGNQNHTPGQMRRLWKRGHKEEITLIEYLEMAGHTFLPRPIGQDGKPKQHRIEKFALGHGGGSCDELGYPPLQFWPFRDKPWLYEFKTIKQKYFTKLQKEGVARCEYTASHFDQMNMYGPEFGCEFCLYLCVNKDDDDIHWEVVCLNPAIRDELKMKAHDIVTSQIPPHKFSGTKTNMYCKNLCSFIDICHHGEQVEKNCRSCASARAVQNGVWHCDRWGKPIPPEGIPIGCDAYKSIMDCKSCGGSGCPDCAMTGRIVS